MFKATGVLVAVSLLMGASSALMAQSMQDKAVVTFDRPVEVPGKVLPPGAYVFKTLENNGLVQIFNGTEQQLFATVLVVPEDRAVADVDCYVQLTRTRADSPQEVEGFFMPGRTTGLAFVYPVAPQHHKN